jgi:Domain of Unknown Function (DUF913)
VYTFVCVLVLLCHIGDDTRKDFSGAYDGIKALVAAGGITLLLDAADRYWPTTDSSSNTSSSSSSSDSSSTVAAQQSEADDVQEGEVEDVQQREVATSSTTSDRAVLTSVVTLVFLALRQLAANDDAVRALVEGGGLDFILKVPKIINNVLLSLTIQSDLILNATA